ncbi:MAG TPA: twin-arginine translocase TatA/TatE family subunit [Solirubrobacteraceae bacterium]|jgi:sec-independent protein translocase protein TatA
MGLDNPIHIAFVLVLLLLVFGAKRLPEMGRSIGSGMRGFKDAISGEHDDAAPIAHAGAVTTAPAELQSAPQAVHTTPQQAVHTAPQPAERLSA